jgi:hypothetical protein
MAAAAAATEIFIEAFETYPKQTCRNHCSILGPNGMQVLSIPVIKPNGNHTLTKDIAISAHHPWQKTHWRSIETAYNNSPFFLYYQDLFLPFYTRKYKYLLDLNLDILQAVLMILKAARPVILTDNYLKTPVNETDLRSVFGKKKQTNPINLPAYTQVFETRFGFVPDLSILDILFNLGPETSFYLEAIHASQI